MSQFAFRIDGIGFWASGLPGWDLARRFIETGELPEAAPRKPAPDLLPPNERRRAPDTVALAIEVAMAACRDAGADPAALPSVFTSTHGDLAITDYMCASLAEAPRSISPTKFHNSVHNAAAGYWTIGVGCHAPATALSAFDASFAQGLLEAAAQLADGAPQVLLVAYDAQSQGPLGRISRSEGLLAAGLVLSRGAEGDHRLRLEEGAADRERDALAERYAGNAMAPMLPLFSALARGGGRCLLPAGPGSRLSVELAA
ncbi:beta-ketoacyl synthase chain length factor [Pseudomarimonas salicorniae]|uniref:Beta-ketoacyl synthase chain length factor n=1 Tax=Pseudomarimonas salicorniae TaxID=2933270 RepID=A0ABT0GCV3_9GAMM|nr:beta-ketoacyl synthase chain length factor [Lysobacter sp. CAU 1642]MCK7592372.1 beta-ketoacyl synthase chain length factor [Lysobacter sp. CAU 1642]